MKKFIFLLLYSVTWQAFSQSKSYQIDVNEACEIATEFFGNNFSGNSQKRQAKVRMERPMLAYKAGAEDDVSFYVFNNVSDGFVLIGGKSDMPSILGFSYKGSFSSDNAPDNFLWWIQQYETCGTLKKANVKFPKHSIAPLLTTKWGQNEPFNNAIPTLGSNYKAFPTGCTATAMSQVMKYYEYPQNGIGSNYYSITYNGTNTLNFYADFANTNYDWKNMLDDYSTDYNQIQADAVATLMYHTGVSENMKYSSNASSANSDKGALALINYFNYDKGLTRGERKYFTDEEWENIIYNELANGRPVLYSGRSVNGEESVGHEFICHGYNADYDLYAINWGWAGLYDGYFALTGKMALNPYGDVIPYSRSRVSLSSSDDVLPHDDASNEEMDCDKEPVLNYKLVPISEDPRPVIGVVADGTSQVKIVLESSSKLPSSKCGYSYSWELSENIGTLENTESWNNIIYTAPENYPMNKSGSAFQIQAILTCSNENVSYKKKVDIVVYKVPVLFVHGLNDQPSSWGQMIRYMKGQGYPDALLHCVDYSCSHNDSFEKNKNVVGNKAISVIEELFDKHKIVCEKVDVVGHSMGGLLTKKYMQENGGELFHKVITINTPHGGSQLGNFATDPIIESIVEYTNSHTMINDSRYPLLEKPIDTEFYRVGRECLSTALSTFLPSNSKSINEGAVYDLSVGGDAISRINTYIGGAKCHAIVTTSSGLGTWLDNFSNLLQIWRCLGYSSSHEFLNELYNGEQSDLVVPLSSQYGGLSGVSCGLINGPDHLSSIKNTSVQKRVVELLSAQMESSVFSNGFSQTPNLTYNMPKLKDLNRIYPTIFTEIPVKANISQKRMGSSTLSNNNLSISVDYEPENMKFHYQIVNGNLYNNIAFACLFDNNIVTYTEEKEGNINLPNHSQGNLVIMCEGNNIQTGEYCFVSDTIHVNTIRNSDLESIAFVNDTIYIREKERVHAGVICQWSDGTISVLDNASLSISNSMIASTDKQNFIIASRLGATTIKASFLDKECIAQIVVYNTPTEIVDLFDEEEQLASYSYTSEQTIYYNIKPDEGGEYAVCPASKDDIILSLQSGETIESLHIDRMIESDKNLYFRYIPYNSGLADVKFQYGIIFRNIINGNIYSEYGGSTDNLYGKILPSGSYYSQPITISFSTSILPYNGIYEVLPAYSMDNGSTWQTMYYNVFQNTPKISIEGGENDELVPLPINISSTQIQVGKSTHITYSPYYTGDISYVSSDYKIAEITNEGEIIGISKGITTISASVEGDSNFKADTVTFTISVVGHECNPLILAISNAEMKIGETAIINKPNNYYGTVNYEVNPEGIVKVSPSGLVTAISSGHAIITAISSSTYDYYSTTNAINVEVAPASLKLDEDLCISKAPILGTENVIYEGNSLMSVTILNNTEYEMKDATLYYRIYLDNGRYWDRWTWCDLSAGKSFTHSFDLLSLKDYMTPGKKYTCYFYKDSNYSLPMNVPSVTFQYGAMEKISFTINNCATISLPFDSNVPTGMHAYEVKAYYEDILVMAEVPFLNRNHSYIVCGDSKTYMFTGVVIPVSTNPKYGFMTGLHNDLIVPQGNYVITNNEKPMVRRVSDNEEQKKWSAYLTLPSFASLNFPLLFSDDIATNVENAISYSNNYITGIYSIDGKRLSYFQHGLNIIKYSNGMIQKVFIK